MAPTPEQLEIRLKNLLDTCTYVVYNYTRRGLFDRDKLIVLTLLTFQILLTVRAMLLSVPFFAFCQHAWRCNVRELAQQLTRFDGRWLYVGRVQPGLAGVDDDARAVLLLPGFQLSPVLPSPSWKTNQMSCYIPAYSQMSLTMSSGPRIVAEA